jgi:hypothetical protein
MLFWRWFGVFQSEYELLSSFPVVAFDVYFRYESSRAFRVASVLVAEYSAVCFLELKEKG